MANGDKPPGEPQALPEWASEQDRRDYQALPPHEQRKMRESFKALEEIGEIPPNKEVKSAR